MAKLLTIKCDCCGHTSEEKPLGYFRHFRINRHIDNPSEPIHGVVKEIDVCGDCYGALDTYFERIKEANNNFESGDQ